jgi:hypothetical protein
MKIVLVFSLLLIAILTQNLEAWEKCTKTCASEIETCIKDKACKEVYAKCLKRAIPIQCFGQANSFYSNRILKCATTKCDIDL